ncbi:hypothetical protein N7495_002588 [Penicillium taxi]|uniref:uncharacterized protein n=1 Tax=Penicillium taxi TaxID=168475 RepID=UPI0025455F2A|nr:uncharacterized protein N7495_002588 [Penicillium taxi]KAJ5902060.1 hypothetical protein N7495_002588 [Penicillium taxi]
MRRIRSACDQCHTRKLRCSGGEPCANCQLSNQDIDCAYSLSNPLGRPKGVKNKSPRSNAMITKSQDNVNTSTLPRQIHESRQMIDNGPFTASCMPYMADPDASMASSDSGGYDFLDEDFLMGATNSLSFFGPSGPCTCTCLQQHASLLSHLRRVQCIGAPLPVDILLSAAQRTFATLKEFTHCTTACHGNTHEEAMLLSALSLRNTFRLLQGYANFVPIPMEHPHIGTHALDHRNQTPAHSQPQTHIPHTARGAIDMKIGGYHVEDDEREMVSDMLALHILSRIEFAVAALLKRVSTLMQAEITPSIDQIRGSHQSDRKILDQESDMGQVQHVLRGLGAIVDDIRRSLHWRHHMTMQRSYGL